MLYYALLFLLIALVAGFFGFYSVEHAAVTMAKVLFFIFIVLLIISLLRYSAIL